MLPIPHVLAESNVQTTCAASETVSIEEILGEYHEKLVSSWSSLDAQSAVYNSQQSTSNHKTLEEETVDILTATGYEAYNVISSNREALERELQTDFSDIELDLGESYIVVISGDEDSVDTQVSSLPEQDIIDDGGGESFTFYYSPSGKTYTMRYLTVTGRTYYLSKQVDLMQTLGETIINNMLNTSVTAFLDSVSSSLKLGTVASLFGLDITAKYSTRSSALAVMGSSLWTRRYIQVWDEGVSAWCTTSYSEYAHTNTACTGLFYNESTQFSDSYHWETNDDIYSPNYYNTTQLKQNAVAAFLYGSSGMNDRTGNISLYFIDKDGVRRHGLTIPETI